MRMLIIEDDIDTLNFLQERSLERCFAVDIADNGQDGIRLAKSNDYDIILLDYLLPEKDGFTVCKEIREQFHPDRKRTPIIMISVTGDVHAKITGLRHGADDYITKPFFFEELFARIQAIIRRPPLHQSEILTLDNITLDSKSQKVLLGNDEVYLTKKEFSLLEYLMRNKGIVVSRGAITEHVWDMHVNAFSNTIEMHILNLRKKLGDTKNNRIIHSVPGRGYKIDN